MAGQHVRRDGGREGGREGWRDGGMEGWRDGGWRWRSFTDLCFRHVIFTVHYAVGANPRSTGLFSPADCELEKDAPT